MRPIETVSKYRFSTHQLAVGGVGVTERQHGVILSSVGPRHHDVTVVTPTYHRYVVVPTPQQRYNPLLLIASVGREMTNESSVVHRLLLV